MTYVIHRAGERGGGDHGWLSTRYSFSFNDWYEPSRMGFGALRVINDDRIAPAAGFPPHSHRDMEIITIVTEGAVAHTDSTGSSGITSAGEVQVMSAGSGITHAEYNASSTEWLSLLQIWIETSKRNVLPQYATMRFTPQTQQLLVAPHTSPQATSGAALGIHQDAYISRFSCASGTTLPYTLFSQSHGLYIFTIQGSVSIDGQELHQRDAIAITGASDVAVTAITDAQVLILEVPLRAT